MRARKEVEEVGPRTIALATGETFHVLQQALAEPHVKRVTAALPIALLAALVAIQTLTGPGGAWTLDARVAAVGVAVVALILRAPFIVVVVLGAATAALLRLAGWA